MYIESEVRFFIGLGRIYGRTLFFIVIYFDYTANPYQKYVEMPQKIVYNIIMFLLDLHKKE